jgi:hypothetical protein
VTHIVTLTMFHQESWYSSRKRSPGNDEILSEDAQGVSSVRFVANDKVVVAFWKLSWPVRGVCSRRGATYMESKNPKAVT